MLWGRIVLSEIFQNLSKGVGGQGAEEKYVEGVATCLSLAI